jgi:hypothetical protein
MNKDDGPGAHKRQSIVNVAANQQGKKHEGSWVADTCLDGDGQGCLGPE